MAMGKVMPRFIPKPHHKQTKPEVAEVQVAAETQTPVQEQNVTLETAPQSNVAMAGGFACPELAMGKVIIRREDAVIAEEVATEAPAIIEDAPVVVEASKVEAPVIVEATKVEAPVVTEAVQAETTPVVEAEAPQAESAKVEEVPVVEAEAPKAAPKATVAKKQAAHQ